MNTTNTQDPINPADVQVETVLKQRGSFAPALTNGIKLTHTPTGISVTCTHERSAHANRAAAWRALEAALQSPAPQPPGDAQQGVVCEPQRAVTSDGWTDWICPKPVGYLMQCCDCGLVHEVDSRVAHYKPRPSEEYSVVDDPDMQAQWRMRRRDDLAATAQASEPSAEVERVWDDPSKATVLVMHGHQLRNGQKLYAAPARAVEPLTEEQISEIWDSVPNSNHLTNARAPWLWDLLFSLAKNVERAHGITTTPAAKEQS